MLRILVVTLRGHRIARCRRFTGKGHVLVEVLPCGRAARRCPGTRIRGSVVGPRVPCVEPLGPAASGFVPIIFHGFDSALKESRRWFVERDPKRSPVGFTKLWTTRRAIRRKFLLGQTAGPAGPDCITLRLARNEAVSLTTLALAPRFLDPMSQRDEAQCRTEVDFRHPAEPLAASPRLGRLALPADPFAGPFASERLSTHQTATRLLFRLLFGFGVLAFDSHQTHPIPQVRSLGSPRPRPRLEKAFLAGAQMSGILAHSRSREPCPRWAGGYAAASGGSPLQPMSSRPLGANRSPHARLPLLLLFLIVGKPATVL